MDRQDAVIAHLDRRMKQIGATTLGILALCLLAAMTWQQDPETVAVQNIIRTQRLELTNAEGNVVAILTAVAEGPEVVTSYYDNGLRRRQYAVVDNQWDGPYTSWASNGLKLEEGQFRNGKRHGAWRIWHAGPDYGTRSVQVGQGEYVEGSPHGLWTSWHDNGQKSREERYEHGVRVGMRTRWHENGVKSQEGRYEQGEDVGIWTWWHDNGAKSYEGMYEDGKAVGKWTRWWPDGSQKEVGEHRDGEEFGIWQRWHENGQKAWEGENRAGMMTGHWTFWDEDGSIDEELTGFYENDEKIR